MVAQPRTAPRPALRLVGPIERPTPAQRPYQPVGAALDLLLAKEREILLEGPAGTGKSRGGLEKAHICASKYAGMRALFVRKTRASMTDSTLVTFEDKVLPEDSPIANGPARTQRHAYHYANGSEIVIGGMDKASKVMSTEYDLIVVDEGTELSEDDLESLSTRLRNGVMPYQQLIVMVNPGPPSHWLNQRALRGAMRRLLSRHEDNPRLFRKGAWTAFGKLYMATLDALTGVRKKRLRYGIWAMAEGMVYDDWDPKLHLIDPFPIPQEWRRFRVVDFGFTNPFVCSWFAIDGDGRLYRYREIYKTQTLVSDHAEEIKRLSQGETYEATVADHDAEDRATLHAAGIPTIPAYKPITVGIQAVQARLRKAGDGKPRLFLFRDALTSRDRALAESHKPGAMEEEIEGYIWAVGPGGRVNKEEPVKLDDHGMDVLKYGVAYADGLGAPPGVPYRPGTTGHRSR